MTLREKVAVELSWWKSDAEMGDCVKEADKVIALLSTAESEQRETGLLLTDMVVRNVIRREFGLTNGDYDGLCNQIDAERKASDAALTRPAEQQEVADLRHARDEALRDVQQLHDAALETEDKLDDLKREVREECAARELAEGVQRKVIEYVHFVLKGTNEVDGDLCNSVQLAADRIASKLAASSLTNAALRTALEKIEHNGCVEDAHVARAALALPADSLAQEVVKYMRHWWGCERYHDAADDVEERLPCTCGLDAVLAKLGGPK
jgi:hypothetical protein